MTTSTLAFSAYTSQASNLSHLRAEAVKQLKGAAATTQAFLLGCACSIEEHGNTDELTRFIADISNTSSAGKVVLDANGRQIGRYMTEMLPIRWDKESQTFKLKAKKARKDFNWEDAAEKMAAVRWDKFGKQEADQVLNPRKILTMLETAKKYADKCEEELEGDIDHRIASILKQVPWGAIEGVNALMKEEERAKKAS